MGSGGPERRAPRPLAPFVTPSHPPSWLLSFTFAHVGIRHSMDMFCWPLPLMKERKINRDPPCRERSTWLGSHRSPCHGHDNVMTSNSAVKPPRGQPSSVSSSIVHYNSRNPNKKRVPPSSVSLVAMERPVQHALARSRLLAPREHVAPRAPGGAQLLALDKAVHPLAAAEVELPLNAARAGL